ncbi:MAG TPA: tetratricopeptide repeat protein [Stellaceae bacterium]|nr:tetratricopeptide repeat protein [Stellaceae bacterium]
MAGTASLLPLPKSLAPAEALRRAQVLLQRGRLAEAEQLYDFVLKADRNNFAALHNLAVARIQQERYEDAVVLLRRALNRNPNSAEALNNLGIALQHLGRVKEAIGRYEKALAIQPNYASAHSNLGIALKSLERHAEALPHFEKALAPDPDDAPSRYNLATELLELGYCERAVEHLEQVLTLQPDFAPALKDLGHAFEELGRVEEAQEAYRRAIALKPDYADAFYGLGIVHESAGHMKDAEAAFTKAIELNPQQAVYYYGLANAKRLRLDDPHFIAMQELAETAASRPATDQMRLHFAMGKALEDNGEYERSFQHLLQANAIKRRTIVYDEAGMNRAFEQTQTLITASAIRGMAGLGNTSSVPIFVIGMPRSGTTLVEQIVASHPVVFGAGERADFLEAIQHHVAGFPKVTIEDVRNALPEMGRYYIEKISAVAPSSARITDKMPANFCFAGLVHLALPNARIIHVRRNAVDTCVSIFSKLFTGEHRFAYDLGELGRYYRAYERLMEHWRRVLPEGVMLEVQYEDVVADLDGQARRIIAHCGLEWDDACLAFHKTERPVRTASKSQVRQPIYKSSVGRWRLYGDKLAPLFEALGIAMAADEA